MELKRVSEEVSRASKRLSGIRIPVFAVLESQMGDPVLSHWVGPDGIVAGTALGRVSAYLFNNAMPSDATLSAAESATEETGVPLQASPTASDAGYSPRVPVTDATATSDAAALITPREAPEGAVVIGMPSGPHSYDSGYESEYGAEDYGGRLRQLTSQCLGFMNYIRCGGAEASKAKIGEVLPGRYTVFASFSDEAVRAVFIHNRMLYCLIGTSSIAVYDVDKYTLANEYRLSLSRNAGYKQITFAGCKILVDCMRGSTIVDPVSKKQINSTHRVYPSNVLDFNGSEMMCYYRNINKYFVQVVTLDDSVKKVLFSIAMPKSVYLVTHGKFWGRGRVVVVTDMLTISVFKYHQLAVPVAKRRLRVDIVALCGGFRDFLAVLTKEATLKLLHCRTLETFFSITLYPATFELGWPYTLVNHDTVISFTSDEGVYCIKLPRKVMRVASAWREEDSQNTTGSILQSPLPTQNYK
ncbi:uncharacterized protein BcabD6B2_49830 [Babesia caballi]|uniref:Uncharacterized protein n=1 Tax=Babesia caballi TaxID=5871 RepID=A0AAV4LZG3_BABCB|nr:hypothetical protein, conserved [Babesia caballi]